MSSRLVLATRNEHKRREFARLIDEYENGAERSAERGGPPRGRWTLQTLPEEVALPPEDGETFAENALGKARAAAGATGLASIADDSGIEAAALGGRPGVRSARYAGESASDTENLNKLLLEAPAGSPLRYVCALAYVDPDGCERLFEGRCEGVLAAAPAGERGFGYDPAFVPDEIPGELTMAQLSDAEKDRISHRGRAASALIEWLNTAARAG
jgi:XTP/dITP diphosphohydrolase